MRFLLWIMAAAAWLLVTSVALPRSPMALVVAFLVAVAIAGLAVGAGRRPQLRLGVAALGAFLVVWAALWTGASGWARVSDVLVGALVLTLALLERPAAQLPAAPSAGAAPANERHEPPGRAAG